MNGLAYTRNEQFGALQKLDGANIDESTKFINHWKSYMISEVMENPKYSGVRDRCKNQHEDCSFWAMIGECDKNPSKLFRYSIYGVHWTALFFMAQTFCCYCSDRLYENKLRSSLHEL
jgi:hypothetical protein